MHALSGVPRHRITREDLKRFGLAALRAAALRRRCGWAASVSQERSPERDLERPLSGNSIAAAMSGTVKVFGRRPSPVARLGTWPAYGNRPSTNPRGCGDGLWGFRVLLG